MKHGQVSIFLKPFIVIIFAFLLIFIIQSVFTFQGNVAEQEQNQDFLNSFQTIHQDLLNCLEPATATIGTTVINGTKAERFQSTNPTTEPDCAEDFTYGYNVTIQHSCLNPILPITATTPSCDTPETLMFGETIASGDNGLENQFTVSYPVVIQDKPNLRVPGTMKVAVRDGDLERFYGYLNKVMRFGRDLDQQYSLSLSITNKQELCTDPSTTPPEVCIGQDACIPLKNGGSTAITGVTLPPGSHAIQATYRPDADIVAIEGGVGSGC